MKIKYLDSNLQSNNKEASILVLWFFVVLPLRSLFETITQKYFYWKIVCVFWFLVQITWCSIWRVGKGKVAFFLLRYQFQVLYNFRIKEKEDLEGSQTSDKSSRISVLEICDKKWFYSQIHQIKINQLPLISITSSGCQY